MFPNLHLQLHHLLQEITIELKWWGTVVLSISPMVQVVIPIFTMMMVASTKWRKREHSFIQEASCQGKLTTNNIKKRNSRTSTASRSSIIKMDQEEIPTSSKVMVVLQPIKQRNKNIDRHSEIHSENGTRYHFISSKEAEVNPLVKINW